jgi:hypothetical protein
MSVLDDKMRIALNELMHAQPLVFTAVNELRMQGYATEATNLETVLTNLKTRTTEAIQAVNLP